MARIAYGVAGEGRGHATRSKAIARMLARRHTVRIFTSGQAYDLLAPSFADLEKIPGFTYEYRGGRFSYLGTIRRGAMLLRRRTSILADVTRRLRAFRPDLLITDFEPFTPCAAREIGVPFLSIDHSHYILVSALPVPRRFWLDDLLSRLVVICYYQGQAETVVSSFYPPPLRRGARVRLVGPIIREDIRRLDAHRADHCLVYVRRGGIPRVTEVLRASRGAFRFYGDVPPGRDGPITFKGIDEAGFIEDLASARAVICTAGNQLVGEALFLGKPVLGIPEASNYEQHMNGVLLDASGCGEAVAFDAFSPDRVARFLGGIDEFAAQIRREAYYGNDAVLEIIEAHLDGRHPAAGNFARPSL